MYIFAVNLNGEASYLFTSRIYFLKIYDNEKLTKNFIPCYSTTTVTDVNGLECPKDTIGLYDIVNGQFYTNQGSGAFLKGNDV